MIKNFLTRLFVYIGRQYKRTFVYPKARRKFQQFQFLNVFDSIQYIIDNRCSLSRYGDGELCMMDTCKSIGFQKSDEKLRERLIEVVYATDAPNHKIGFPYTFIDISGTFIYASDFWGDIVAKHADEWVKYFRKDVLYLDSLVSRFFKDYIDYDRSTKQLNMLKQIWNDRDIVIVEGSQSRTGIGNDLYDNAKTVQRIIGHAKDAFSHYDEMVSAITNNVKPEDEKLLLLSYGPTATVLAYDLAKLGYQAIDIGHLDIEYEWYLSGKHWGKVKGKYTNESHGGDVVEECNDPKYLQQIICDITK